MFTDSFTEIPTALPKEYDERQEVIKKLLKDKEELPNDWADRLIKTRDSFAYGSFVYGGFVKGKSDIDIALHPKFVEDFEELCTSGYGLYVTGYSENNDFRTLFCMHKGELVNFSFFYDERYYNAYKEATRALRELYATGHMREELKQKNKRVEMFEFFVDLIKRRK
jgi:hypothetical protein